MARTAKKPTFPSDKTQDAIANTLDNAELVSQLPPKSAPNRTPIQVQLLTFPQQPAIRIYGKQVATSCERRADDKLAGYLIELWPWVRSFRIIFQPNNLKEPPLSQFVPMSRVTTWEMYEGEQG